MTLARKYVLLCWRQQHGSSLQNKKVLSTSAFHKCFFKGDFRGDFDSFGSDRITKRKRSSPFSRPESSAGTVSLFRKLVRAKSATVRKLADLAVPKTVASRSLSALLPPFGFLEVSIGNPNEFFDWILKCIFDEFRFSFSISWDQTMFVSTRIFMSSFQSWLAW